MPGVESDASRIRDLARRALDRDVAEVRALPAGLGSRRFHRVRLAGDAAPRTLIARVEAPEAAALRPAGVPPEPPLEPVRALFERHGLPVPRCFASAPDLILLEDVGDRSLESVAGTLPGAERLERYREACALVPRIQALPPTPGVPNFERRLDDALFRYKAEQVVEWVLPLGRGERTAAEAEAVRDAFSFIAETARAAPQRLAHRDFKAANLHLHTPAGEATRLTLIDLQGAFLAPPEYDLVCLLRDSQVALEDDTVRVLLDETRPRLPDAPDPESFSRRFALLTLTRNGKDLARFRYAAEVRGDDRYLAALPRALRILQAAARSVADLDPRIGRLAEILTALPEPACGG